MVYILVLNWNGWRDTVSCLESIYKSNFDGFKIIVCDNGSEDNSFYKIKSWFDFYFSESNKKPVFHIYDALDKENYSSTSKLDLIFIKSEKNLGYAGGNNLGLKYSLMKNDMSHVWILNNDTEIDPNSLIELIDCSRSNNENSVIGSKLIYSDSRSTLQGIGGKYNYWLGKSSHVLGGFSVETTVNNCKVDYPIGASMFIPRKCLEIVGLLSEDYFLYYEELDFANRAKRHGFNIDIAHQSIVYHKEGASINKSVLSDFYFIRNKFIISYKYKPFSLFSIFFLLPLWSINRFRRRDFKKSLNCYRAFYSFLKWCFKERFNDDY